MTCPVCKSSSFSSIGELYDDRYGYQGKFALLDCDTCGHKFLKGMFSPELLRDLYSNYYPRSLLDITSHHPYEEGGGFIGWFNGEKSSTFRWVPANVRVLDIGCGFGESLGYYQSRGCDAYGVEADENIRRVAEKFGYKVHVGLFDPEIYEKNYFDYVTMSQVIEHVTDPVNTLQGIARVLKPGGIAILSTPNAQGWGAGLFRKFWINWHAPYHLQFFTLESMNLVAQQAGLIVERTVTITPSDWLYYQWIHLLTYPSEGKSSVFWKPGASINLLQKICIRALYMMRFTKINHVITRFFDATGWGDNRIYFIRKP